MTEFQSNYSRLKAVNPMLAQNYKNLNAMVRNGVFNTNDFGLEDKAANFEKDIRRLSIQLDSKKYNSDLKASIRKLEKEWAKFDTTIKGKIDMFTSVANDVNKAIGVNLTNKSVSTLDYFTRSPQYLGLKSSINVLTKEAGIKDAERYAARQREIQQRQLNAQLAASKMQIKGAEKQANFFTGFGKSVGIQAISQIWNEVFDAASHGYQYDQQISLMKKDFKAAYDASIKKRNVDAIKDFGTDIASYAAMGTMAMPGVGTLVGAIAGAVVSGVKTVGKWDDPNEELQKQSEQLYQASKYLPADLKLQSDNRFFTDLATNYSRDKEANIKDIKTWAKYSDEAYKELTDEVNAKTAIIEEYNTRKAGGQKLTADELTEYARTAEELNQLTKKQAAEYSRKRSLEQAQYDYQSYSFGKSLYNSQQAYQNAAIEYGRSQTLGLRNGLLRDYQAGIFQDPASLQRANQTSLTYTEGLKAQLADVDNQIKSLQGKTDIQSENQLRTLEARRRQIQTDIYKEDDYRYQIGEQLWKNEANKFNLNKQLNSVGFAGRISNTLGNPFVQINEIENLFSEALAKQTEISKQLADVTGDDEFSLAKKAKLVEDYNKYGSFANQLKSARDSQYNQILAGAANSKYLTSNLGSFGRWAGTNDASAVMTRLTSQQNQLLQRILDALLSEDRGMYYQ